MFCAMYMGRQQRGVLLSKGFTLAGGFFVLQRRYCSNLTNWKLWIYQTDMSFVYHGYVLWKQSLYYIVRLGQWMQSLFTVEAGIVLYCEVWTVDSLIVYSASIV